MQSCIRNNKCFVPKLCSGYKDFIKTQTILARMIAIQSIRKSITITELEVRGDKISKPFYP